MVPIKVTHVDVERLEREHHAAVTALREIRDNSISWDDAIHIAVEALHHTGVVPQPKFEDQIQDFLAEHQSLGAGLQRLAAGEEEITQRMLTAPVPEQLLDDLRDPEIRCASCERQESIDGPAGLCDGCLEALEDDDAA